MDRRETARKIWDGADKVAVMLQNAAKNTDMGPRGLKEKRGVRAAQRFQILSANLAIDWIEDDVNALGSIDVKTTYHELVSALRIIKAQRLNEPPPKDRPNWQKGPAVVLIHPTAMLAELRQVILLARNLQVASSEVT